MINYEFLCFASQTAILHTIFPFVSIKLCILHKVSEQKILPLMAGFFRLLISDRHFRSFTGRQLVVTFMLVRHIPVGHRDLGVSLLDFVLNA